MVQVIENRADIEGRVVALKADAARPGHQLATIEVGAAAPVEGYPNLFASYQGKPVEVVLPAELAVSLRVGTEVRCRVRRAGPAIVLAERCTPR